MFYQWYFDVYFVMPLRVRKLFTVYEELSGVQLVIVMLQVEVREWRMGAGRKGGGCTTQPDIHTPREPELRGPLDEGAGVVREGEADQQDERQRTDNAQLSAQVRAESASR